MNGWQTIAVSLLFQICTHAPVTIDALMIMIYDTPAANALYEMLPLELTLEGYNGVEKISYLPQNLAVQGEPDGCDLNK